MDTSTFFEKFELIADIPDGIVSLRKLIKALAVTGRLTDGHPTDISASELVKDIRGTVEYERTSRKLRTPKITKNNCTPPCGLKSSWIWMPLGELAFQITDGVHKTPTYVDEGIPFLSIKDISSGRINLENTRYITNDAHRELTKRCKPERGDLLITRIGTLGVTVAIDTDLEFSIFVSVGLIKFPQKLVLPKYLELACNSEILGQQFEEVKAGGSHTNKLNLGSLHLVQIPLPPLAEQKRIVAKVDELMALCDQLEAQQQEREQQRAQLNRAALARFSTQPTVSNLNYIFHKSYQIPPADLRKTILTLAVQGKLVPQDPHDEPASHFLDTIAAKSAEYVANKRKNKEDDSNPKFYDHLPKSLPSGWESAPIEDLFKFIDYRGRTPKRTSSGTRLITAKNVKNGFLSNDPVEYVSDQQYTEWMTRGIPQRDDILFVTEGHTMGFAGLLKFDFKFALAQRTINLQPFFPGYSAFYLNYILSESFQSAVASNATGSAAQGVKASKLKRIRVVIPPLAEQRRIVAKVDQLMALVAQLEAQLEQSRSTAKNLLNALVAELTA